jgi:hypothetical protein
VKQEDRDRKTIPGPRRSVSGVGLRGMTTCIPSNIKEEAGPGWWGVPGNMDSLWDACICKAMHSVERLKKFDMIVC